MTLDSGLRNKSDRFVVDQKSAEKRPATVLTQRQKNKKAQNLGYVHAPILSHNFKKCVTCGRQHSSRECWWCSEKCFSCGKVGHKAVDCRKPQARSIAKRIIYQGRVYALTNEKMLEAPIVVIGTFFY